MSTFPQKIRSLIIEISKMAGVGHIGSSLSIADLIGVLFEDVIYIPSENHPERDRFVLSKGHAGLALYCALYLRGYLTKAQLETYCQNNSLLGVHPKSFLPYVDFSTGSLGQGVCYAVGAALAAKMSGSSRRVYCIMSDAELNEGCVWEAFLFANHHALSNLTVIIDNNGQQALGFTKDVINIPDIEKLFSGLNVHFMTINGHEQGQITQALQQKNPLTTIINAKTISGKGVDFMEGTIAWHYKSLNEEQYHSAKRQLHHA
jgi:transketolase